MRRARLLIGGAWVDGIDTFAGRPTSSPAQPIGHADRASREQVDAAVAAAHRSFQTRAARCLGAIHILRNARRADRTAPRRARGDDHRGSGIPDRRRAERSDARHSDLSDLGRRRQAAGRRSGADRGRAGQRAPHGVHDSGAARRGVRHHVVQRAAQFRGAQGGAGAGRRATRSCSRRRRPRRSAPRCSARSCSTPACRRRTSTWCRDRAARSAAGLIENQRIRFYTFTGSTERRQAAAPRCRSAPDRARTGQHRRDARVRRRRSRPRGAARGQFGVSPRRPGVHVDAAAVRAPHACSSRSSRSSSRRLRS